MDEGALAEMTNLVAGIIRIEKSETVADALRVLIHLLKWISSPIAARIEQADESELAGLAERVLFASTVDALTD